MKQTPKFVTKLFAAIDGYAEIKEQSEQQALNLSRTARDTIKPLIEHHSGVWMHEKNGEIFANFTLPEDAVNCAVAIQREVSEHPDVKLRIGIHTGDIKSGIGTGDIVASGIAKMAASGGVCVSDKVYSAIQNKVDVKAEYIDDKNIEGIERPVRVYALIGEGLSEPVSADSHDSQKHRKSTKPSIAVLPFVNMSADPEQEYFCDGMTEEIITDLSQIHDLLVISRSSAMTFKGTKKKIKEIAKEVNVQHVLEGSVRKAGNNLRITAQLIDATNDTHLWAEKYSGTLDDVFDIQEKVSRSIVDALKVKLSHEENKKIAEHPIDDIRAYDYYLRARYEIYQLTEESLERALQFLNNGLEIFGENILIFEGLGHVYYQFWNMGIRIEEKYLTKAKDYGMKILAIEHDSPYGHFLLGLLQITGGIAIKSLYHFKKVLDKEPDHVNALAWTSAIGAFLGKTDIVEKAISRLSKIDPFHPFIYVFPGILQLYLGQFESALEKLTQEYQSRKKDYVLNWGYSLGLLYSCHFDEAFTVINRLAKDQLTSKILILLYYANQKKEIRGFTVN